MSTRPRSFYILALLLLISCAPAYRGEVSKFVHQENWSGAEARLEEAVQADSSDWWAWRELGRARLETSDPGEATQALEQALSLRPADGPTQAYLGAAYEKEERWADALAQYEECRSARDLSFDQRRGVRARLIQVTRRLHAARAAEMMKQPGKIQEDVVAVYPFVATDVDPRYAPLRKGLAVMLITDLKNVRSLTLVERLQIEALLEEIRRGGTEAFDQKTRVAASRMLGAGRTVNGSLLRLQEDVVRLSHYVTDTDKGVPSQEQSTMGAVEQVLRLEKEIAYGVIDQLHVELTEEERAAIGRIPTESFPAFLAFSEGLDLEDQGRYVEARQKYEEALRLDPLFREAEERAMVCRAVDSDEELRWSPEEFVAALDAFGGGPPPIRERLDAAAVATTSALGDEGGAIGTDVPPVDQRGAATIRVRVPVR